MAELRHHRPDQPERGADDQPPRPLHGTAEIHRLLDMQKGPEKPARPSEHRIPAAIQDLFDKQKGPKRDVMYSTPDTHKHSPEKPPQKHPDIAGPYGPLSELAQEPERRIASSDRRHKAARAVDTLSDNAEDIANDVQGVVDTIMRVVDDRPAAHEAGSAVRQPFRPTYSPVAKDAPHDVISNVTLATVFVVELGRRMVAKGADAMTHRRQDTA